MLSILGRLCYRELLLAFRKPSEVINPLLFFLLVISLFPLGIAPDKAVLQLIAPGLIWVACLLANLMGLSRVFTEDQHDGSLLQINLVPYPMALITLAKALSHWITCSLPIIIFVPIASLLFSLNVQEGTILLLSLLLGTPSISLIGVLVMSLGIGYRQHTALSALLLLPLVVPVLIFAAGSVELSRRSGVYLANFALLGAIFLVCLCFAPLVTALILRLQDK